MADKQPISDWILAMTEHENQRNQPSGESACSAAWMRRHADQVERLDKELKYLYHTVDVIEGTQRRILDQLDAVSSVQPTQSASEDWRRKLRTCMNKWLFAPSVDSCRRRFNEGYNACLLRVKEDLKDLLSQS